MSFCQLFKADFIIFPRLSLLSLRSKGNLFTFPPCCNYLTVFVALETKHHTGRAKLTECQKCSLFDYKTNLFIYSFVTIIYYSICPIYGFYNRSSIILYLKKLINTIFQ